MLIMQGSKQEIANQIPNQRAFMMGNGSPVLPDQSYYFCDTIISALMNAQILGHWEFFAGFAACFDAMARGTIDLENPIWTAKQAWDDVNNITANAYGDAQWSDSDPVLTTYEVEVSAGDVVEIMVMTYDPENPWAPPAGSVEWTLSTKEAVPPLVITQQPVDSNSIIGGKAEFSVVAEGEGLTYQWYVNKNDGAGFVKATYTGNKTAALSIPVYESRIGWTVYCVITDAEGNTLTTDTVTLTLKPADIDLTYQTSGTQYVVVDKVATFVVTATSSIGEITYQWQISSDGGATWSGTTWNGYNTRRLYVNAYDSRDGWMVRCIMTDAEGARLISEPATLAIKENPLYVVTQAENAEVVLDTTVYFNFEVGGNVGDVSYTWFISGDDGVTWAKTGLTGFNTTQLRVNAYNSRNGKMFKCIAIDSEGNKLESAAVKLTLKANPITIVKKPTSATVSAGETAYFTFQVENFVGEVSYQWYYRKSADGSWSATGMTGAKTDTLEVAATAARNGYQYYCMATDTAGNKMKSNAVTLTVE